MNRTLSTLQSTGVYLRLRGRRLANIAMAGLGSKKKIEGKRTASSGKSKSGFLVIVAILYLTVLMFSASWRGTEMLIKAFPDPALFARIFAYKFLFQIFFMGLVNLGNRELARTDSDIEWLASLPAPWSVLLLGKVVERAFFNIWFFIAASALVAGKIMSGMGITWAFSSSILLLFPVLMMSGLLQVLAEYTMRLNLAPNRLRNAQATLAVLAILPIVLTLMPSAGGNGMWAYLNDHAPSIVLHSAPALAARIGIDPGLNIGLALASYALQIGIILFLGIRGLGGVLKKGVMVTSQRESARSEKVTRRRILGERLGVYFPAVVRRELTLLARDRSYLVQTLLVPILVMGIQLYPMMSYSSADRPSTTLVSTVLFFSLSYILAFSSFQALNSEGQALWVLFSLPQSLEKILKQKLCLWLSLTLALAMAVLAVVHFGFHVAFTARQLFNDAAILAGIFIYAWIAVALGVFGSNPLSDDVQKRIKPSSMFYYLGLISFFLPVFLSESYWTSSVLIVLVATLAYSLWQEAKDYLPCILDPVSAPPSRVSLAHGSVAALVFFLGQILLAILFSILQYSQAAILFFSFTGAGLIAFVALKLYFWRKKTTGIPAFWNENWQKHMLLGVASGVGLGLFGFAYLKLNAHWLWFELPPPADKDLLRYAMFTVAVLAAPIFEEFIFRGLVFQGLKRSFHRSLAVTGSALIFAAMHPPISFLPVFALGVVSAGLFQRSKALTASILAHATSNAIILLAQ